MKKQLNYVVLASLVVLAGLVWLVARSQRNTIKLAANTPPAFVETPQANARILPAPVAVVAPDPVVAPPPAVQMVEVGVDDPAKHVAQPGETVNSLATDLLGKNTKTNRDAIIEANPSLKANPDKLLAGKTYQIPPVPETAAAPVVAPEVTVTPQPAEVVVAPAPAPTPTKVLKYTAATGDTVSNLAGAFLGNDDQKHQDKIINANPSLQDDPDHVEVGKVYRIPAPHGLSASADASEPQALQRPTTQPDSDQVISAASPRTLRYTARSGDTVTTLAIQLLGSDTQEARDAIINNNPALKQHPDLIIAGQTYWIPAPTVANP